MNIDKAIDTIKNLIKQYEDTANERKYWGTLSICMDREDCEAIETALNELDKKDKVIDLMAEFIGYNKPIKQPKEEIKEYFYKKAEEENES